MDIGNSVENAREDKYLTWVALGTIFCWAVLNYCFGKGSKLRHIPSAVGTDKPLISYIGAIKYMVDSPACVNAGVEMTNGRPFKLPDLLGWTVVISDPKMIDELKKMPDDTLSNEDAVNELLQIPYTFGRHVIDDPVHTPIVRTQLTRALPRIVPLIYDEIRESYNEYVPISEDWTSMTVMELTQKVICRASNRMLVGLPLCRDTDFLDLSVRYTIDTMITAMLFRFVPSVFRPFVSKIFTSHPKLHKRCVDHLSPVIAARRAERANGGDGEEKRSDDGHNDFLSWLMDASKGEDQSDWHLMTRLMTLNFAAIHTSAITFVHALYYLTVLPSTLVPQLREEVEQSVDRYGWTKEGIDAMEKVDSFIKESQRLHTFGCLMSHRVTRKDITTSDGTTIPSGTFVAFTTTPGHTDEEIYKDPLTFDPFRFVKMKQQHQAASDADPRIGKAKPQFDIVSLNKDWRAFGTGRHACPGRFFVSAELKLMVAHLITTYDMRLEGMSEDEEGVEWRPKDSWILTNCIPNAGARIKFRKRKT